MQSNTFASSVASRIGTAEAHFRAIERVILAMRERLGETLTLDDMAEIAIISPYHFDRVFRQMIGIPPCQFLGTLRMEAAKRLLLTTHLSVTDICFEVGYNSLGTFITRFTQLVGLAPRRLRCLAKDTDLLRLRSLLHYTGGRTRSNGKPATITGEVSGSDFSDGLLFVGLFPTPVPQSRPAGCVLLTEPGSFHIPVTKDGNYYALAAAIPWSEDPLTYLLTDRAVLRVAITNDPLSVQNGKFNDKLKLELRSLELTDPPLLIVLPLLLNEFLAEKYGASGAA